MIITPKLDKYFLMEGDKFVALDDASGGYPSLRGNFTDCVKFWNSAEEAIKYSCMFKERNFKLFKLMGISAIEYEYSYIPAQINIKERRN